MKTSNLHLNYWESYDNCIDFMAFCIFRCKRIILEWQLCIGPHIIMGGGGGIHPQTIKRKHFYQPKQGKPDDCRTTLILQTKILKDTLCPEIYRDLRQRDIIFLTLDISGPALRGSNGCKMCSSWLINKIMSTICPVTATTGKIKITSTQHNTIRRQQHQGTKR